jgi:RhoGAP domain
MLAPLLQAYKRAFDLEEEPDVTAATDVHLSASLLKLWLRELPEPLMTFAAYEAFIAAEGRIWREKRSCVEFCSILFASLIVCSYVCGLFSLVLWVADCLYFWSIGFLSLVLLWVFALALFRASLSLSLSLSFSLHSF